MITSIGDKPSKFGCRAYKAIIGQTRSSTKTASIRTALLQRPTISWRVDDLG
jgi:hypothetical protein